jgi:ectoine hydroxylase-related dioxygenase (phytanoyl-CoA dioxygenase family)
MTMLSAAQQQKLEEEGFLILPGLLSPEAVAQVRERLEVLWAAEGSEAGQENHNAVEANVRRLANLANKGDIFRDMFAHPVVLAVAEAVMGPEVRLSMLNAREVPPQIAEARQAFHTDTDNCGKPDTKGFYSCTAVWMLDSFTLENGATRIVPGTHRSQQLPKEGMADPYADHPNEVVMTGNPGDVGIFNGHCWHAGGVNVTANPRLGILAHYLRADIPRPSDRRQHISPEVAANLSPRELELLGVGEKQYVGRVKLAAGNVLRSLKTKLPV